MNLVAHQYLSFNNPSLQLGNFLGEVVKGNKYNDYPDDIKLGILLHREIDSFTDSHDVVKRSSTYFHSTQHKYSPIVVDLVYDYFLIKHWRKYHPTSFQLFKENCYELFSYNTENFPTNLQEMLNHLLKNDWFENYSTIEGIQKTLTGISKRVNFDNNLTNTASTIYQYETELEKDFLQFFPELVQFSKDFIQSK
ncbi:acyl carrier protein phosphodiesterase [Faecalibacter bovis]|uniref:DUF479 domain-containing protein n=1 Tax=Faecalibacter bovis TaxID=2898187 RepID=A0ABX7X9P6_9FLAO|nr:ACP phosphodiesterase [Faecalibacter bovis]QTV04601.1 DUF479 domain-containing protein [Faecalibacter bovis]